MKKMSVFLACIFLLMDYADALGLRGTIAEGRPAQSSSVFGGSPAKGITVAGGNGPGFSASQLTSPWGIFVDVTGNIFISDQGNNRIQKWAPGAAAGVTVAGGAGAGAAANQLDNPLDVSVDQAGNVYIDEGNNQRIQKWAPGASSGFTVAGGNGRGNASNQLADPFAIFVDAGGNIYIADQLNSRIQKWAPGASSGVTVAGGNGYGSAPNQIIFPTGVFVDRIGNVYVSDAGNNRVQKWAPGASAGITVAGGNGQGSADNQLNPGDLFVDYSGNIYVIDNGNNRVQKWAAGAAIGITVAGGNGPGAAADQLYVPNSIFLDQVGNIYISDGNNHRVQKFAPDQLSSCLPNLNFTAPSCNGKAIIQWSEPHDSFPASIAIPGELDLTWGNLNLIGELNGHGYYKSTNAYPWSLAKDISFYVGDTNVNGHLVTISSAEENKFIFDQVRNSGYSPWIGLYNTGKPGRFAWVTGEPYSYTNWGPGEPNNYRGNAYMKEPYVRFMEGYGNWNDQQIDNVPFIAEFEEPLIHYKQISGPANGSTQSPGVYQVCYEKSNYITGEKETCCFSITVNCASSIITTLNAASSNLDKINSATSGGLSVSTSPNPSQNYFRLRLTSNRHQNSVDIKVTDVMGKVVESRKGVMPDQTLEIGSHYRQGIYFAQVTQGKNKVMLKMVKQ